jgi:hypothetical protein
MINYSVPCETFAFFAVKIINRKVCKVKSQTIYGLLAGTIITLYLLPILYYLMEKRFGDEEKY